MKKVECEITGTTPILMCSPKAMLEPKQLTRKENNKTHNPIQEAKKYEYKNRKGKLYIPNTAIKGTILNAASWKKSGKIPLKPILAGNMKIQPEELILNKQKYETLTTTVVLRGKDRILCSRPMIKDWKIQFEIIYDNTNIENPEIIKECLKDAGERIGILAWRPQKGGEYGTFKITKWKEKNND